MEQVNATSGNVSTKRIMKDSDNLRRDDFDGGPVSLDEIDAGLWLGNVTAATDLDALQARNITSILTVDSCPLPSYIQKVPSLTIKYIQASDVAKEDLLSHFENCIHFINESLDNNKIVLVHCYFGVSRSAAVVIAYIMQKYKISFSPALERVKCKRRFVGPNTGFIQQLRLFYKMGWKIDPNHEQYKVYRLRLAADKVRKAKILPQTCMDLIKSDPGLIQTNPEPIVYRCRKCRRIVAARSNLINHKPANGGQSTEARQAVNNDDDNQVAYDSGAGGTSSEDENGGGGVGGRLIEHISEKLKINSVTSDRSSEIADAATDACRKIYFIEPLAWMDGILRQTQGKLNCPKCSSKLGNFSWIMGCHCQCGTQISPAFYLIPSKVDLCHSVQNVQITV